MLCRASRSAHSGRCHIAMNRRSEVMKWRCARQRAGVIQAIAGRRNGVGVTRCREGGVCITSTIYLVTRSSRGARCHSRMRYGGERRAGEAGRVRRKSAPALRARRVSRRHACPTLPACRHRQRTSAGSHHYHAACHIRDYHAEARREKRPEEGGSAEPACPARRVRLRASALFTPCSHSAATAACYGSVTRLSACQPAQRFLPLRCRPMLPVRQLSYVAMPVVRAFCRDTLRRAVVRVNICHALPRTPTALFAARSAARIQRRENAQAQLPCTRPSLLKIPPIYAIRR